MFECDEYYSLTRDCMCIAQSCEDVTCEYGWELNYATCECVELDCINSDGFCEERYLDALPDYMMFCAEGFTAQADCSCLSDQVETEEEYCDTMEVCEEGYVWSFDYCACVAYDHAVTQCDNVYACEWGYVYDYTYCDCVVDVLPDHTVCEDMGTCDEGHMPNFETCTCDEIEGYEYPDDAPNFVCPDMPACGDDMMPDFDICECVEIDYDLLNYDNLPTNIDCPGLTCEEGLRPCFDTCTCVYYEDVSGDEPGNDVCPGMGICGDGYYPDFDNCECILEYEYIDEPSNEVCPGMGQCGDGYIPDFVNCVCWPTEETEYDVEPTNGVCPDMGTCDEGYVPDFSHCVCMQMWDTEDY